ncbi:YdcF family protein [Clostridium grantii]|uniref:Uncharacterized SAM-binding protein YcdF, DUF218 family n=1 Tax=Clostridium grantii DSM 8605 TaxID=1121316 RepID=A0A1M5VNM8_9CLOT|nr:YdcF family protein [Clostridium grantii]SHH76866.1 Uncharacterized SAM-binding protein YcdF, DUF218 family [Clostridium grantii DSM 8605]
MLLTIIFIILGILSLLYYAFIWWMSFSKFWIVLGIALFLLSYYTYPKTKISINVPISKTIKCIFWSISLFVFSTFLIFETVIITNNFNKTFEKSDYLIVLGAGLRGSTMSTILVYRMEKSLDYLEAYPNTKVIVSGGQGSDEDISEAQAMKDFLVKKGIPDENIIMEDKSTSTLENLIYSKRIIEKDQESENKKISLITNGFHVFRAEFLAKRVGLKAEGIPAKTYFYTIPNFYVREYFAFIKSFIFDRI